MVVLVDLQPCTPSNHRRLTSLLLGPPHFLYQAPPGAQQLTWPDFLNVPHVGHTIVIAILEVMAGVLMTIRSRLNIGVPMHTCRDIDPGEPVNIRRCFAFEFTQAALQSIRLNDVAWLNMLCISVTLDTSHFERSVLNELA